MAKSSRALQTLHLGENSVERACLAFELLTPIMMFGIARTIQGIINRGWKKIMGIAVEIIVKTKAGKVDRGTIKDQSDLPVLSSTFWRRFLVFGSSAVETGRRLIPKYEPDKCTFFFENI